MKAEKARKIDYCNSISTLKLLPALVLSLTFAIPLFVADYAHAGSDDIIDGKFTIQPYLLPDGQGYRHVTGGYDRDRNEYIFFGGISNGGPSDPTTLINSHIYTLDLNQKPINRQWVDRGEDTIVVKPWHTSTSGILEIGGEQFLGCDDTDDNTIYKYNKDTRRFEFLTTSPLEERYRGGDCCSVGVTIPNSRDGLQVKEQRIYMIGGKNGSENPFAYVRYYSITHDAWEVVADLNEARSHLGCAAATTQGETKIYAIGGGDSPNGVTRSSMEVYNVVDDKWELHEGFLSENGGRTRLGVQNMDNKYLFLIGGDTTCAGSTCPSDQPMSIVEIVRIKDNKLISDSDTYRIPQLQSPRHTPATKLVRRKGNNLEAKYVLFVTAGRTRDSDGLEVLATTETLEFKGINVKNLKNR